MPELTWVATDLKTGLLLADLPDVDVPTIKSTLGRYESASATLPLPTAPENWQRATLEGASCLISLSDNFPIWGGMVTEQKLNEGDELPLNLATIEAYFDRRYVGDEMFTQVGQNVIIKALVEKYAAAGSVGGIPIRVQFVTAGVGKLRDREYKDIDDKTLYSVLVELMGVEDGPEWTVGWEWQHDPERITPVLYVGDRIGKGVPAGMGAAATFEMPGCVESFEMIRSYTAGKGANDLMAVSTAAGATRPQSARQVSADLTRPTFEHRWTPSTSITNVGTLTDNARAAAPILADGSATIAMSAKVDESPVLGFDWAIGDDIGFSIGGLEDDPRTRLVTTVIGGDLFTDLFSDAFGSGAGVKSSTFVKVNPNGRESVPAFPGGFTGVARAIGWQLDFDDILIITPTLLNATVN